MISSQVQGLPSSLVVSSQLLAVVGWGSPLCCWLSAEGRSQLLEAAYCSCSMVFSTAWQLALSRRTRESLTPHLRKGSPDQVRPTRMSSHWPSHISLYSQVFPSVEGRESHRSVPLGQLRILPATVFIKNNLSFKMSFFFSLGICQYIVLGQQISWFVAIFAC